MTYRNLYRRLNVLVLAALLALAAVPVHALPSGEPDSVLGAIGSLWESFWGFFVSAWQEEGIMIDPNGLTATGDEGMTIDPDGVTKDEGMTIDPHG